MRKTLLIAPVLALPLALAGWVYGGPGGSNEADTGQAGFVCPLTGEELPCPKCCPAR